MVQSLLSNIYIKLHICRGGGEGGEGEEVGKGAEGREEGGEGEGGGRKGGEVVCRFIVSKGSFDLHKVWGQLWQL